LWFRLKLLSRAVVGNRLGKRSARPARGIAVEVGARVGRSYTGSLRSGVSWLLTV